MTKRSPVRLLILAAAILALVSAAMPAVANADGDPASDVLAVQTVFLPQDSGATTQQQAQLAALESAATASGYQIRVALIASPTDLGSVGELWRQPQSYAAFLGQELALNYRGTLLVAMPNGFGLYGAGAATAETRAALMRLGEPGRQKLVAGTLAAIGQLAAASGHRLAPVSVTATRGGASTPTTTWIALALGSMIIAIAWAASFRASPPKLGRRGSVPAS